MARSSVASRLALVGSLFASFSASPSFAVDIDRCFHDNWEILLKRVWVSLDGQNFDRTDVEGCITFYDVDVTADAEVTVLRQNSVVRMDDEAGNIFLATVDLHVDRPDDLLLLRVVDFDRSHMRIAETMRTAYNNGLREFSPWQTESPVGAQGPGDSSVLRVMWPSVGIVGEAYTEPAGFPSGYPRIHMDTLDSLNTQLQIHELAHALHLSKLTPTTRGKIQTDYVEWLIDETTQGNTASHNFAVRTIPLVAYLEAFGCFGEVYPSVAMNPGDHHENFFGEVETNLGLPNDACGGIRDTVRGADVEGAVFLALFHEFAQHPAVGLPFVVETMIDCDSMTVFEYAKCIMNRFGGIDSEIYQALDLAGARYGIDFEYHVSLPDEREAGDFFGKASAAGDFNGDGFEDLAIAVPGEGVGSASRAGAVHILFGSALALVTAQNQYFDADSDGVPGMSEIDGRFGAALAAGDFDDDGYTDLAIGVPGQTVNGSEAAGSVVVLYGSAIGLDIQRAQSWHQDVAGIEDHSEPDDGFGSALATGDFNGDDHDDLAIGAPGEDLSIFSFPLLRERIIEPRVVEPLRRLPRARFQEIPNAGAVTVIYGNASDKVTGLSSIGSDFWNQSLPNVWDVAEAGDAFGSALAAGDFDDQFGDDLAIGVPLEDIGTIEDAGAVQILYGLPTGLTELNNQGWHQDSPNVEDSAEAGDFFGSALAAGNFGLGLGAMDLAIGVPGEDVDVLEPPTRVRKPSRPRVKGRRARGIRGRRFIRRPAAAIRTVIDAGAVSVLQGTATAGITAQFDQFVTQTGWSSYSSSQTGDRFGSALAAADFDGKSGDDLAIGAPYEDVGITGFDAGVVDVIFSGGAGLEKAGNQQWHEDSPFVADDPEAGDWFGASISAGDFNGDGFADMAIGVPGETPDDATPYAGALQTVPGIYPDYLEIPFGDIVDPAESIFGWEGTAYWHQDR